MSETGYNDRMKVKVLGCYGGPALGKSTTSFLLDEETLIDGGTIVSALDTQALSKIRRIFLSHVHLDHIMEIPFFIAASGAWHDNTPIEVYAMEEVIDSLDEHLFNGVIWPDFYRLPGGAPLMKYIPVTPEEPVVIGNMELIMVPVNHTVACAGMLVTKANKTLVYTADSITTDRLWEMASQKRLTGIIAEVSFPTENLEAAQITRHYTPDLLARDLAKIDKDVPLLVFHLKPEVEDTIRTQLEAMDLKLHISEQGRTYVF